MHTAAFIACQLVAVTGLSILAVRLFRFAMRRPDEVRFETIYDWEVDGE